MDTFQKPTGLSVNLSSYLKERQFRSQCGQLRQPPCSCPPWTDENHLNLFVEPPQIPDEEGGLGEQLGY